MSFPVDRSLTILAEYADLSTCTTFVSGVNVQASNQLASCEGARVVIVCDVNDADEEKQQQQTKKRPSTIPASSKQDRLFSNFEIVSRAVSLYGKKVSVTFDEQRNHFFFTAPDCVMIIGIQPFEVMAQLCASHSALPSHRIIAPGTMIDSAHFRCVSMSGWTAHTCLSPLHRLLIAEKLDVSPASITGMIVGGHRDNNLALWNSITIGGIHLLSENPSLGNQDDPEGWHQIHTNVNRRQAEINQIKGNEVWSISMASSELVECVLRNKREIHPVTVNIKGYYGVKTDLFLSIPAIISQNGVSHLMTASFSHQGDENQFSRIIESINTAIKDKLSNSEIKQR